MWWHGRRVCRQTNNSNSNGQFVQTYHEWRKKKSLSDTQRHIHDLAERQDCWAQAALSHLRCLPHWFLLLSWWQSRWRSCVKDGVEGTLSMCVSRSACVWKCCKNHLRLSVFYFGMRRVYFCSHSKWMIFCHAMIKPLDESKELRNRAKSDEFCRISSLKFQTFKLRKCILEFGCVTITPQHHLLLQNYIIQHSLHITCQVFHCFRASGLGF